ncbi:hypothetical protein [Demequina pelophila]|uniref:hypothetical protein n=1 Tax=Demequina pelophila TaxID=1638984 RepID=UPI000785772A|nr:hypothetical protein [Demequina pelophila]
MTEDRRRADDDRHDALRMADALDRRRALEARQAGELCARFAQDAVAAGIAPEPLTARAYSGRGRYRTPLHGWYLKRDRSVAVGTDGMFYVMQCAGGLAERLRGATVPPADAPLELGRGARDGESLPLTEALANRLAAGNSWG